MLLGEGEEERAFVRGKSSGPFEGGRPNGVLFASERNTGLDPPFAPHMLILTSCLAKWEVARRKGTLDTGFGSELFENDFASPHAIFCLPIEVVAFKPKHAYLAGQISSTD